MATEYEGKYVSRGVITLLEIQDYMATEYKGKHASGGVITLCRIQRPQDYRVCMENFDSRGLVAPFPIASVTISKNIIKTSYFDYRWYIQLRDNLQQMY